MELLGIFVPMPVIVIIAVIVLIVLAAGSKGSGGNRGYQQGDLKIGRNADNTWYVYEAASGNVVGQFETKGDAAQFIKASIG